MKHKFMKLREWTNREFEGEPWDNRTIRKKIESGELIGVLNGKNTLIRSDQTLDMLASQHVDISDLIALSS